MRVYVDDEPYAFEPGEPVTIGQVAERIKASMPQGERMLVAIRCDGEEVSAGRLAEVLGEPVDRYGRVDFETGSPRVLAADAVRQAGDMFEEGRGLLEHVVELLNQGQTTRGLELLGNCLNVWNQAGESVRRTAQLIGLGLDAMTVDGQPLPELFAGLREQLNSIKAALEGQDYVLLADILQYELPDSTQRWQGMIQTVLEEIESGGQER